FGNFSIEILEEHWLEAFILEAFADSGHSAPA
ncbi:MAG TPA: methylmalonyl-CoA epimerase, partial [Pseudomonas sp.]|nr:methylmalonyl-CoA epimerase [Pseudomonas sp.]